MEIKLRLILKKIPWLLGGKALGLAALWLLAPWWAFFIVALFIYIKSGSQSHNMIGVFAVLLALTRVSDFWLISGIEGTPLVGAKPLLRVLLAGTFALLFLILFGIKELFFVRRREFYLIAATLILYLTSFFTLWFMEPGLLSLITPLFALFAFVVSAPLYLTSEQNNSLNHIFVYSGTVTFLLVELLWSFSYLSLSIIGSSAILTAFFFITSSLHFVFEKGSLTRELILRNGVAFLFISIVLLIFA